MPEKNEQRTLRKRPVSFVVAVLLVLALLAPNRTEAQRLDFIRDAEIENSIRAYSTPLFQAAGLSPSAIEIYLVKDKSLNAFVSGGQNIFIHTGLLLAAEDPLEVIGVIAHETGHISGGHLAGRTDALEAAQTQALIATILGLGAAVATGQGELATAGASTGQDFALKGLFRYTRSQESSADQAAVTYLTATHQSPKGMLHFMDRIAGQEVLLSSSQDPYLRTHPLTQDRISFMEDQTAKSPYKDDPAEPAFVAMHDRIRAKLIGFLEPLQTVLRTYPETDNSLPARYARAIAYYQVPDLQKALPLVDGLIAEHPDDPYFHELKGQMFFENGRIAEALPELEKAVELIPTAAPIRRLLAQVQIELNAPDMDEEALENLQQLLRQEPNNSFAWRLVAIAHGRLGNEDMTTLALAESAFARGAYQEARDRAQRALKLFKAGTPASLRAQDLEFEASRRMKKLN